MAHSSRKEAHKPQADKFKAMAKEVETDESEAAFDAKLKKLAKAQEKPAKGK